MLRDSSKGPPRPIVSALPLSHLRISYANGKNASSIRDVNATDTKDNGSEEIFFRLASRHSMSVLSHARALARSHVVPAGSSRCEIEAFLAIDRA